MLCCSYGAKAACPAQRQATSLAQSPQLQRRVQHGSQRASQLLRLSRQSSLQTRRCPAPAPSRQTSLREQQMHRVQGTSQGVSQLRALRRQRPRLWMSLLPLSCCRSCAHMHTGAAAVCACDCTILYHCHARVLCHSCMRFSLRTAAVDSEPPCLRVGIDSMYGAVMHESFDVI